jgi:hypothetical protein
MKTIKVLFWALLCGFQVLPHAQAQKFKINLQGGFMNGGNIYRNELKAASIEGDWGWNAGADVNYFFTGRFFAGIHFNSGQFLYSSYIWDKLSDTYYRDDYKTDGTMTINNVGLVAGYCLPVTQVLNLTGQIGFAQFIQIDAHPVATYFPDERSTTGFFTEIHDSDLAFFSASFPVKFSIGLTPFKNRNAVFVKNIEIGYAFGFYIEPDFGLFTAIYHGPQLSVKF